MKSVHQHVDFRVFLREVFEARKLRSAGYTYKQFAFDLGFVTPSLLQLILLKRRNLQMDQIHMIARSLAFNQSEHESFEALVLDNQSGEISDKRYYAYKRGQLLVAASALPLDFVIQEELDLLKHPSLATILMALHNEPCHLTAGELEIVLQQKTGLLKETIAALLPKVLEQKSLSKVDLVYKVDFDLACVRRENIPAKQQRKALHKQNLGLALEVLESRHGEDQVKFLSYTFTLKKADFEQVYAVIKDLPTKLAGLTDSSEQDSVAQLNMQFFTLK